MKRGFQYAFMAVSFTSQTTDTSPEASRQVVQKSSSYSKVPMKFCIRAHPPIYLPVDESAHFAAQLALLIRGTYFERSYENEIA
jgi:hypothetical protein